MFCFSKLIWRSYKCLFVNYVHISHISHALYYFTLYLHYISNHQSNFYYIQLFSYYLFLSEIIRQQTSICTIFSKKIMPKMNFGYTYNNISKSLITVSHSLGSRLINTASERLVQFHVTSYETRKRLHLS